MAREFDELRSMQRPRLRVQDPSGDTFKQRYAPFGTIDDLLDPSDQGKAIRPGTRERFLDPSKVISQNIPPSPSATNMKQFPLQQAPAPETTGSRPPPGPGLRLPEGGQGLEGLAAGTLPPPPFLQLIEMLHKQRGIAQGIPGRARGGPVEAGKPYKVGERGPETFVADSGGKVPLPEGFSLTPDEPPQGGGKVPLPEGFTLEPSPQPAPAPTAGPTPAPGAGSMANAQAAPADAFEAAALRQRRGVRPEGGRGEGAITGALENALPAAVPAATKALDRLGGVMYGGNLEDQVGLGAETAMALTPGSPAALRGVARAAAAPEVLGAQRLGVDIPRAALGGPTMQATARATSSIPIGGAPLRRAATRADEQLAAAGTEAAARPTGEAVTQDIAGGHVRRGIIDAGDQAPAKLRGLARRSNEDAIGEIVRMAGSKTGADTASLAQLRRFVPAERQAEVQSALIERLGRGAEGEFDAATWVRGYGNLSDRGKTLLFGRESADLRQHLDAIEAVSRRAPQWQQFNRERATLGSKLGTAAVLTGAVMAPMTTLGAVVGSNVLARGLARSATAAPMASWARAYERLARGGGPQALAAFAIATKNLNKNLGTELTTEQLLDAAKGGGGGQE